MPRLTPRAVLSLLLSLAALSRPAAAGIFISELCDPRLNYATDRFIEIYNPDASAVDLTGWRVVAVANGVDAFTWTLSGVIDSHQTLVAGDATTVTVFPVAFPAEAWSGSNGNWNGKVGDGAKLVDPLGVVTDYMVATGTAFENADYVRKPTIGAPNPTYAPAEWTSTPVDLATDASPGTHNTSAPAGPTVTSVHTDPTAPTATDPAYVLADVTDSHATITSVVVNWGTSAASQPNAISLAVLTGITMRSVTPIPAQAGGTTVYYRVAASNDLPATTLSPLQNYAIPVSVTVHDIQGEAAASPYAGAIVLTHGVVTARFGTTWALQDGAGAWNGLWVRSLVAPNPGDSVTVTGQVTESDPGQAGNTMIVNAQVLTSTPIAGDPVPNPVTAAMAGTEAYEGQIVELTGAVCTSTGASGGEWLADDGSGPIRIGVLGGPPEPILGSTYRVVGVVAFGSGAFKVEPRDADAVTWTADHSPPAVVGIVPLSETSLRVIYSEIVQPLSAVTVNHYAIPGLTVGAAAFQPGYLDRIILTVTPMVTGNHALTVTGVADQYGNVAAGAIAPFSYHAPGIPTGYYDGAAGLQGEPLRLALHDIIKGHVAHSYDYAWTAYYTTDVRPDNGRVWDIYSDIPGGTPPYLYDFGVDQGGIGGAEGTGYTREHTWCKNWFGGEVSPMYTDLFALYPCDTHMNGTRGVYPYGETAAPQFVSLNGSRVGPSSVAGYTGTVFEPRHDFKGDLARVYLYFSTRYATEDAGWPGGPATIGATIAPWALSLYLRWNDEDPVSQKEIDRNNAVYAIQGNRNPFVDRPGYVDEVFRPVTTGVDGAAPRAAFVLQPGVPNPSTGATRFVYGLERPGPVRLRLFDVRGALVRTLKDGPDDAGGHVVDWDGRDDAGRLVAPGVYFYALEAAEGARQRKVVIVR